MVEHLVIFKFNENASDSNKINMLKSLNNLKNEISEIKDLSCGENFTARSQGFGFGLRVLFESESELNIYLEHPAHVKVVNEVIKPIISDLLVIDYQK